MILFPVKGEDRAKGLEIIRTSHYTRSVPSGKTHVFLFEDAVVLFSIPANQFIGKFLFKRPVLVWELTRLWAPDGHDPNLLSRAVSAAVRGFARVEPAVEALVSYADPNVGHSGGVYRACSWTYTGVSEESRYYVDADGRTVARRAFHSGSISMTKAEILALGYKELKRPGKIRFVFPLTKKTRKEVAVLFPKEAKV